MNIPTPLIPLTEIDSQIYAKIEYQHPSGSMKHRSIPAFLAEIQASGELQTGQQIAIRSAGSAAVTAAWAGARLGVSVVAVLPLTAMQATVKELQWLGAAVHQVPADEATCMMQAFGEDPKTYVLAQVREARLIDHYRPVAREIVEALDGEVTAVTVGIGTGLSVTGIAREMAESAPNCQVFGVEPAEAAIASGQPWAPHGIPGLAPPIPQPLLDKSLLAGILPIPSAEAWDCAREAAQKSGLMLGPSSGVTLAAALRLREQGVTGPIVHICACSILEYLEKFTAE